MNQPQPEKKQLLLMGGGHTHAIVLRMWGMQPMPGVALTLVSDATEAPYSGMLPGLVAGQYRHEDAHIDLRRLCAFAGARFIQAEAVGVDLKEKAVLLSDRPRLSFDVLSINVGSTPDLGSTPGAREWSIPSKPVPRFLAAWEGILKDPTRRRIVIVGGGAGGVELALCMKARLPDAEIHVLQEGPEILPTHNRKVRSWLTRLLKERGIDLKLNHRVAEVKRDRVRLASSEELESQATFWVTQASPAPWMASSGLACGDRGFVAISPTLQSLSHPFVFAAGDCATIPETPRPKSGVFAVRQGRPLFENLQLFLEGRDLRKYRPQKAFLSLVGTGTGTAVASRKFLAWHSKGMWRLKDAIDRRFMARFSELPSMSEPSPDEPEMRCLGCAAKIGSSVLRRALDRLRADGLLPDGEGVLVGMQAPDDAAVFRLPEGALVQSVDYFPALVGDPYCFGRIMVNHGMSDLFAMGARPHSALAVAITPYASDAIMAENLYQMLRGVADELKPLGARLLGGHSAEGAQLALGLTCNGWVDPKHILKKSGLRPGDALILTKPLGTGVLFAAQMRGRSRGTWIETAITSMLQSNAAAAERFVELGAHGCTDVTGFGLAGHLNELCSASGMAAEIEIRSLPLLPGAAEAIAQGIRSSLFAMNEQVVFAGAPAIVFDPQTSGGLLAGLPPASAASCLKELYRAGYREARVIGRIVEPRPGGPVLTALP